MTTTCEQKHFYWQKINSPTVHHLCLWKSKLLRQVGRLLHLHGKVRLLHSIPYSTRSSLFPNIQALLTLKLCSNFLRTWAWRAQVFFTRNSSSPWIFFFFFKFKKSTSTSVTMVIFMELKFQKNSRFLNIFKIVVDQYKFG